MKRIVATVALAVGLLAATLGFGAAQPAAAFNNAPASSICAWVAMSQPAASGGVTVIWCKDINWYGHYGVHIKAWYPSIGCTLIWVYDRNLEKLIDIGATC
jgi:hypothetical protein